MAWWHYLVLVNFYLVLFYGFYILLLQRETFFQLNRAYLVIASIFSFIIPVIHSSWVKDLFITRRVPSTIYNSHVMMNYQVRGEAVARLDLGQMLVWLYVAGIVVLTIRSIWQLTQLSKIIRQARQNVSYSFFNWIKLEEDVENPAIIAAHEQAHARQWHSVDVIIIEIVMIVNWLNPVVYLYRKAIKCIHEYLADRQALKAGTTRAEYALLLLSKTFSAPAHQLASPFFSKSLLKRRILMLQKTRSKKAALTKYGLSAPLFILMLILSSATIKNSEAIQAISKKAATVLSTPAADAVTDIVNARMPTDKPRSITTSVNVSKDQQKPFFPPPVAKPVTDETLEIPTIENTREVYAAVEKDPDFPGGIPAFFQFLGKIIHYPTEMRQNNIQGRVYVQFVIESDGSLTNIRSVKDPGYGSAEEVVRAVERSPKWIPGMMNGRPVAVLYTIPVHFVLSNDEATRPKTTPLTDSAKNIMKLIKYYQ